MKVFLLAFFVAAAVALPPADIPNPVVMLDPAKPEVTPELDQPDFEPVVMPDPAEPEVVPDFEPVVMPDPAEPEVVPDFEPVVMPDPAEPEVVPELDQPEPVLEPQIAGEVYNDGLVQVKVNAVLSTVQSWFSMVMNYFSEDVQSTQQIV